MTLTKAIALSESNWNEYGNNVSNRAYYIARDALRRLGIHLLLHEDEDDLIFLHPESPIEDIRGAAQAVWLRHEKLVNTKDDGRTN